MNPLVNTILGIAFLSSGVLATFLMLWTRGRVASPSARDRREPASPAPLAAAVPPAAASAATASGPRVADRKPMRVQLVKGEHFWCACGASRGQPFCDGSHRGTPYQPLAFTVDEEREAALCLC
jgi:hypothetical protein